MDRGSASAPVDLSKTTTTTTTTTSTLATAAPSPRSLKRTRDSLRHDSPTTTTTTTLASSFVKPKHESTTTTPAATPTFMAPSTIATQPRTVERVVFNGYEILCSFPSPVPIESDHHHHLMTTAATSSSTRVTPSTATTTKRRSSREQQRAAATATATAAVVNDGTNDLDNVTAGNSTDLTPLSLMSDSETEQSSASRQVNVAQAATKALTMLDRDRIMSASPELQDTTAMTNITEQSPTVAGNELVPSLPGSFPSEPTVEKPTTKPLTTAVDSTPQTSFVVAVPSVHNSNSLQKKKTIRGQGGRFVSNSSKPRQQQHKSLTMNGNNRTTHHQRELTRLQQESERLVMGRNTTSTTLSSSLNQLDGNNVAAHTTTTTAKSVKSLFVCEHCFKYMLDSTSWNSHRNECQFNHPPGKKVYENANQTIYEVDGAVEKVEGFLFYIVTNKSFSKDSPVAYFSKEKNSYDDYNLACIVTFPPYRQQGWATLLIEFSYELSNRFSDTPGTPERPLSDLGLKGYLNVWTSILVRFFREVFKTGESLIDSTTSNKPNMKRLFDTFEQDDNEFDENSNLKQNEMKPLTRMNTKLSLRRNSQGQAMSLVVASTTSNGSPHHQQQTTNIKTRFHSPSHSIDYLQNDEQTQPDDETKRFEWKTTLEQISLNVNLRSEDVAFTLIQSGLASLRIKTNPIPKKLNEFNFEKNETIQTHPHHHQQQEEETKEFESFELVITPDLIEKVANQKKIKSKPMLVKDKVLL
ncbi:hypothetical protein OIO90_002583 [Microbotryomycetes sp. JL221]|nr:hypothetical protein OIO90_002583 [Microbotryomycetes sp. JL221]